MTDAASGAWHAEIMIRAVVFDLDGVLRHFDPAHVAAIEEQHGLPDGSVHRAAFAPELLDPVVTGRTSRAAWVRSVGEQLGNPRAAEEWGRHPSVPDAGMLALSDELRAVGIRTAILTNGTDTIPAELRESGIDRHVDAVFNSAEIGLAKPDVRAFQHVLHALVLPPHEVFFTDDSVSKLAGADALGIRTHHYAGITGLRAALRLAGAPVSG
ncbi:HAD family phosphatase [Microbacterium sp. ARD32]|uniref:HAD family hydrolase n=1 Tax=Microbacterium sp. ARD32 TaxID=2962577 RepID=UPI002881EB8C|nr:HAD family phosphatase [Microbacterium sp. ARD32]MDT0156707.1 HAD family phosphatase [Microbacterium sp. ARD32]